MKWAIWYQVPVESKKDKDKPGVSLMKRLTSRKKSSPPLLHPYSIDNPVFEDGYFCKPSLAPPAAPVHVRYIVFKLYSTLAKFMKKILLPTEMVLKMEN